MGNENEKTDLFLNHIYIYKNDVFRIIYNVFFDKLLAEELTQVVMLNAWKGLHTLKDVKKSKAWVKTITRNVIREHMKKKTFEITVDEADIANDLEGHEELHKLEDDILDIVLKKENYAKLGEALERLDPELRMIVTKHVIGEVTLKDISKETGFKYGKMKEMYKRGIRQLKVEFMRLERGGGLNGQKKK